MKKSFILGLSAMFLFTTFSGYAKTVNISCPTSLSNFTFQNLQPPTQHFCNQLAYEQENDPNGLSILWQGYFRVFTNFGEPAVCISHIRNETALTNAKLTNQSGYFVVTCTYTHTPNQSFITGMLHYSDCHQQGNNHFKCKT